MLGIEQTKNVRIISSDSLPQDDPYLTLSHRWGNPPGILLQNDTIYLLRDDISPYLLDSEEAAVEKTEDIMQMDNVYTNSTLNIMAAEGQVHNGLVFDRDILSVNPCRAHVSVNGVGESVTLQAFSSERYLSGGPLYERGWVFQERALAPRIVHFTKNQVYWECHELEASEVLPKGLPNRSLRRFNTALMDPNSSSKQLYENWLAVISHYSDTSLTFGDDRLLAISALAKRYWSAMQFDPSDYSAGIWKGGLPLSLLWWQEHQDTNLYSERAATTNSITTETQLAPSWSWASSLGEIWYVAPGYKEATAEIVDIHIDRVSQNFFDGTYSCRIRLRGSVCKFHRRFRDGAPWIRISENTEFRELYDLTLVKSRCISISWDTSRRSPACFLLHIATERYHMEDGPMERGIILQRTPDCGVYTRVGSFIISDTSEYAGSELEDAFCGRLDTLDAGDYHERDSDGKYVIDII
ncbi:hypothetical protein QBC35DRAFT_511705 [Podospora australis]|uniref:Heterokaryon incompatibility domain-containing protein n=1 Tax=Podospora australis TaxID=1536484 RepID=A0AAN6X2W3_9PEZI|nr:hypothetical protein QBC35DRAFT_511705 [Podospora australis]